MGNPKQKWTSEEEEALRAGVAKHGAGKWKNIQRDPEFNHLLHSRSNIDLKDKWRNLNVSANAQGSRDKSRSQKPKVNADVPMTPVPNALTHASSTPLLLDTATPADAAVEDNSKCLLDGKTASKYNGMVYEALTNLKDPSGCDIGTIVNFIEQRHEVPPNFRRLLSSRLRRLVQQDKLEKVQNCFRIKKEFLHASSTTPTPKIKDSGPKEDLQNTGYLGDTVEEAAIAAAYMIAEAENKSFVAAEAVKEAERVSRMAEDSDVLLQLAKDIYDKCARGEIVILA
ncbi:PREDICTED: telomere repeat-binding factor 4-like [Ipomoea nil]|uniref:telomere repeat-binding factor 4-like n=1 Tax=Ipomoea nil TaxID=35883 RepID=UPI000901B1E9|nr:PREDICTED: telomere repeat-binding factor 4-like [Ipomoea nil]